MAGPGSESGLAHSGIQGFMTEWVSVAGLPPHLVLVTFLDADGFAFGAFDLATCGEALVA
jgi:hypothetical protein